MKGRAIPLAVLIVCVALLVAAVPAFGEPQKATYVSGLECVYVDTPVEPQFITDYLLSIKGQVNANHFYSDDPATFPGGTNTAVLDILINLRTGMVVWRADAVFQPDGIDGTFEGIGRGWFKSDPVTGDFLGSKGLGVFHGTGELEGLTLKQELFPGDITQCPGEPFDATLWTGFIVPPAR